MGEVGNPASVGRESVSTPIPIPARSRYRTWVGMNVYRLFIFTRNLFNKHVHACVCSYVGRQVCI